MTHRHVLCAALALCLCLCLGACTKPDAQEEADTAAAPQDTVISLPKVEF